MTVVYVPHSLDSGASRARLRPYTGCARFCMCLLPHRGKEGYEYTPLALRRSYFTRKDQLIRKVMRSLELLYREVALQRRISCVPVCFLQGGTRQGPPHCLWGYTPRVKSLRSSYTGCIPRLGTRAHSTRGCLPRLSGRPIRTGPAPPRAFACACCWAE